MRLIFTVIILLFTNFCLAEVDLSPYDLTPEQIEIIRKLEAKGTVSEETLIKLAIASQKHNEKKKEKEYVPEHTLEQLEQVKQWAVGGVFQSYANSMGLNFDGEAYLKSYPVYKNGEPFMAILNFGLATGTEYFQIDIMILSINIRNDLDRASYNMSDDNFFEYYIEQSKKYEMDKFIDL